jgi:hypothetical protein
MNGPAQYLQFGFILISLANLLVIALLNHRLCVGRLTPAT